jgi:alpha-glucosidase
VGDGTEWWRDAVVYQIYPRSYADSTGDGHGDLRGITAHLDHLEWLGVDAIWLSPTFPSPNADWGYDVADYYGVHPDFGTLADLDALIAEGSRRGIRVVLDLVPNHTSIEHPWFTDSRSARDAVHRDWYVWADQATDGSPPNNWVSIFGGPAWEQDPPTGQCFLHNFFADQPDLNWWSAGVRDEFDLILRHWFDRGIAGFRIDVAHMIVKDEELRDNPPANEDDFILDQIRGQVPEYNSNRPEVHDVHRRWRGIADSYDEPRLLVGETFVGRVEEVVPYYGEGDALGLAFNIPFLHTPFDAAQLAAAVERMEELLPSGCSPVWTASNHDVSRLPTRWAAGNPVATRGALLMLLALRGSVFLYYGDELGMPDSVVPADRRRDRLSIEMAPLLDRDAARTPMPWSGEPGAGFTEPGVEPWLPFGDTAACNVADQRADPVSTLHLTRDLIALRRAHPELRGGAYETLAVDGDLWAWERGGRFVVAMNLGTEPAAFNGGVHGTVSVATDRARDGETVGRALRLGPWEGLIVEKA